MLNFGLVPSVAWPPMRRIYCIPTFCALVSPTCSLPNQLSSSSLACWSVDDQKNWMNPDTLFLSENCDQARGVDPTHIQGQSATVAEHLEDLHFQLTMMWGRAGAAHFYVHTCTPHTTNIRKDKPSSSVPTLIITSINTNPTEILSLVYPGPSKLHVEKLKAFCYNTGNHSG